MVHLSRNNFNSVKITMEIKKLYILNQLWLLMWCSSIEEFVNDNA